MAIDPTLKQLIETATVFNNDMKTKWLAQAERFNDAQVKAALKAIQEAERHYQKATAHRDAIETEINQKKLETIQRFMLEALPRFLREAETKDRSKEAIELDRLMKQLEDA